MDTERDPWEAGLGFAVKANKGEFLGREAALAARERRPRAVLRCLVLDDPSVVVMGKEPVFVDGRAVGYVTSAGYCPSVASSVAYAYLPLELSAPGGHAAIAYFGRLHDATITQDPLYDPEGGRLRV